MLLCTNRHTVIEQLNNRKDFESSIEYQGVNLEAKHPRSGTVGLKGRTAPKRHNPRVSFGVWRETCYYSDLDSKPTFIRDDGSSEGALVAFS
jgi:hypothetical protein